MPTLPPVNWPTIEQIQTVTEVWSAEPDMFRGAAFLPVEAEKYVTSPDVISWDEVGAIQGKTQAHEMGNDVKRVKMRPLRTLAEKTAYWKEKITLDEGDLTRLRGLGPEDRDRYAMRIVMDAMTKLRVRLETLKECLRFDAMRGTLVIDENGVQRTVTYGVPAATTVPVLWTDTALSKPIKDIQDEVMKFRGTSGRRPLVMMTQLVANLLTQNEDVRDLIRGSGFVGQIGNEQIANLLPVLIGGIAGIEIYDEGFEDENGNYVTFINDNEVFLVAQSNFQLGEWASTPSIHNGGINGARGGDFFFTDDHTGEANPYLDVVAGIYGIPVLFRPELIRRLIVAA